MVMMVVFLAAHYRMRTILIFPVVNGRECQGFYLIHCSLVSESSHSRKAESFGVSSRQSGQTRW